MRSRRRILLLTATCLGMAGTSFASALPDYHPFTGGMVEIASDASTGRIELELQLGQTEYCGDCSALYMTVKSDAGLVYNGTEEMAFEFREGELVHIPLSFVAPLDTVSSFWYEIKSGLHEQTCRIYFDTRKDPIWWGVQRPGSRYTELEQRRMRLTPEQLASLKTVRVDLRRAAAVPPDTVKKMLGGALVPTGTENVYVARITVDQALVLDDLGVWMEEIHDSSATQLPPLNQIAQHPIQPSSARPSPKDPSMERTRRRALGISHSTTSTA